MTNVTEFFKNHFFRELL